MAVVWLHGVGDTGMGWAGQFRAVQREVPGLKMVHPDAPEQPLTSADGEVMNSWFDIVKWQPPVKPIGLDEPDPPTGLDATIKFIHKEFEELEKSGVPADKIIVGGFSQGGAASIIAGLTYPRKIGGIASISGWCMYRGEGELKAMVPEGNTTTPCLFCCGDRDDVIDVELSRESNKILTDIQGDSFTYLEARRAGHFQSSMEMDAVLKFMIANLK
mmetsp:Transcript_157826/g.278640  ORF Transcript_157826/g.278640 Transcript_157826/m.278640 type:complete len:216 (-) Transcript_157826:124-771(-)